MSKYKVNFKQGDPWTNSSTIYWWYKKNLVKTLKIVVEQEVSKGTWKLQSFKKCWELEEIQEYHQEDQTYIF